MKTPASHALCVALLVCTTIAAPANAQTITGGASASGGVSIDDAKKLLDRISELEQKTKASDARNAELESRLASLEAENNDKWLTQQRADEIRGLVQEVLADADTRASMLQGVTAGYDEGFIISSSDGNYLFRTNLLMQERFVLNRQEFSPDDKSRWGFENARTTFTFSGHIVQPELFFVTEIDFANNDTGFPSGESRTGLTDAYVGYEFGQGWKFQIGTFKMPLLREELVNAGKQLLVERSVVNYAYTGGYTDGIEVEYRNDRFGLIGSYNNGMDDGVFGGGVSAGGTSPITSGTATYSFTFRGEWLLNGAWDTMNSLSSPRGGEHGMMLGAAINYQSADSSSTGVPDLDLLVMTADFSGQFGGWSLFAALMYANANQDPNGSQDAFGAVLQAGFFLSDKWEIFGRYEFSSSDMAALDDISLITFGFTRYLAEYNAKWTTDLGIGLDAEPLNVPITGWRADVTGDNGQIVARSQFQISF